MNRTEPGMWAGAGKMDSTEQRKWVESEGKNAVLTSRDQKTEMI